MELTLDRLETRLRIMLDKNLVSIKTKLENGYDVYNILEPYVESVIPYDQKELAEILASNIDITKDVLLDSAVCGTVFTYIHMCLDQHLTNTVVQSYVDNILDPWMEKEGFYEN